MPKKTQDAAKTKEKAKSGSFSLVSLTSAAQITVLNRLDKFMFPKFDKSKLPKNRIARILIGVLLILGGIVGFLPVVGFWMIPAGVLVLSIDIAIARRWRRRIEVWWADTWSNRQERRRQRRKQNTPLRRARKLSDDDNQSGENGR